MARRILDGLYLWSGYLAALFLVAIALTIIAQIIGRFFGVAIDSTESAGFSLAASTFLGLAYTFRHDGHIRVTLLIRHASGPFGTLAELWGVGFCAAAMAYLTYWSFDLVYFSYVFGDISPGLLAIPFWIPRSAMAVGSLILTIALVDELVGILRGRTPSYVANSSALFKGEGDD
ncbi:TRAP transporter small permease [Nisaea sp.]|uniref:TRAP transporter small permease n=1 Tax=Nisaea sp. TaxID=2024842 RepID=UPI003B52425D